ncbi:S1 family peptidase [Aeoliella mucimassa]|uniref:Uncharacterized protein n=1 Tax=Aeoliella mucimassa TaxID=2527972 RepID=A0A518AHV3_9BACT|nr:serine protease [Aeoliella mucimassa]QDU54311.1 hypothetical protein Pan181_04920 [Aeoliella mucimassa]
MFRPISFSLLLCLVSLLTTDSTHSECIQLPNGTWQCLPTAPVQPREPPAQPAAMDVQVECPTARGSGTAVALDHSGGTLVVTNHHVIVGQSQVVLHNGAGRTCTAEVAAIDEQNDLALLLVAERWPRAILGSETLIGTPVQFRAFDAGVTFRKYLGHVRSEYYSGDGGRGYFATGNSVPGNSGGGVYYNGQLVGVVWGNPDGGTAFVPVTCVRALIDRVQNRAIPAPAFPKNQPLAPRMDPGPTDRSPATTPATDTPSPVAPQRICESCDCDERWEQLQQQLDRLEQRQLPQPQQSPASELPARELPTREQPEERTSLLTEIPWLQIIAAGMGVTSPIGLAMVGLGWMLRLKRSHEVRGAGGPRDDDFPRDQPHASQ